MICSVFLQGFQGVINTMQGWPLAGAILQLTFEFVCGGCGNKDSKKFLFINKKDKYIPEVLCLECEKKYQVGLNIKELV